MFSLTISEISFCKGTLFIAIWYASAKKKKKLDLGSSDFV